MKKSNSYAQVWVETVVYTLIGLTIIGIILAVATPKINELKDKSIIDSSRQSLNEIDSIIKDVSLAAGNQRVFEIEVKKGKFFFDTEKEEISFYLKSDYKYSEPGQEIKEGNIIIKTIGESSPYEVYLKINYSSLNLTINSKELIEEMQSSSRPYKLIILNRGEQNIDIRLDK
ncbi:MAG: hypothetical protein QXX68_02585 [Candidatus Pacearchaeota archaeon]